jgi:hypothetical protein
LWRIIQVGFSPHDPYNLIAREEVEEHLNATAKHLNQQAMPDTHSTHINTQHRHGGMGLLIPTSVGNR